MMPAPTRTEFSAKLALSHDMMYWPKKKKKKIITASA